MIIAGLWSNNLAECLDGELLLYDILINIIDLLEYCQEKGHTLYKNDKIYSGTINNSTFADWLYNRNTPELNDVKREISIKIERSSNIDDETYNAKLLASCSCTVNIDDLFFFIFFPNSSKYNIFNQKQLLDLKRYFLCNFRTAEDFYSQFNECFPNIYFDNTTRSSMNTLNTPFNDIKGEIVEHLTALDNYFPYFKEHQRRGDDNIAISRAFIEFSQIDCSPQAGRQGVARLIRTFYNSDTRTDDSLKCELHTKFDRFNRARNQQDRIYFHPGKSGIYGSKVIVIHIGTHL